MKTVPVMCIYEQELFFSPGRKHYRVMRDGGGLIFDRHHHLDFDSLEDAKAAIEGDFRRNKRGPVIVRVFGIGDAKNPVEAVRYEYGNKEKQVAS
jgi:hypothetical protein